MYSIISVGLREYIYEENPVDKPSDEFNKIVGKIGIKNLGSMYCPSKYCFSRMSLSDLLNNVFDMSETFIFVYLPDAYAGFMNVPKPESLPTNKE